MRLSSIEDLCFGIMLASILTASSAWVWGMARKSFGAMPAMLWIVLTCLSLVCAAVVGGLEVLR